MRASTRIRRLMLPVYVFATVESLGLTPNWPLAYTLGATDRALDFPSSDPILNDCVRMAHLPELSL